jgi:hypothetical protein
MIKTIKIMPDYGCYPLWWEEPNQVGNIDPEILPLSQETINRLNNWADIYDATLDMNDPSNSGFISKEAEEKFAQEGINLWVQLQSELKPNYRVFYFSFEQGKLLLNLSELLILA